MIFDTLKAGQETGATAAGKINAVMEFLNRNMVDTKKTITVAPPGNSGEDYDFQNLEEAMQYAIKVLSTPNMAIRIKLGDGTYAFKTNPATNENADFIKSLYEVIGLRLSITGNGSSNTVITLDSDIPSGDLENASVFTLTSSLLGLTGIHFDISASNIDPANLNFFHGENSMVSMSDVKVTGFGKDKGYFNYNSKGFIIYSHNNVTVSNFRIFDFYSSFCLYTIRSLTLNSLTYDTGMGISKYVPTSNIYSIPEFTHTDVDNVALDKNATFSEGGAISIGWNRDMPANMFKWSGTTAERPDLNSYGLNTWGGCYADTDLGKPIWWINGKWVDASGAEV